MKKCSLFISSGGSFLKLFIYMVSLAEKSMSFCFEVEFVVNLSSLLFHMKKECSFWFITPQI
jgi:hypothetical protein